MGAAITEALKPSAARVKTLTYGNGNEFCGQAQIDQALGSTRYFAETFARWERDSSENSNGLLRQYVPKKQAMANTIETEI